MPPEIVLADDEISLRTRLRNMLQTAGHNVECLSDDNEIISRLQAKRPGLLIVDKYLASGGIRTVKRVREFDPDLKIALLAKDNLDAEDMSQVSLLNVRTVKKDLESHFTLKMLLEISVEIRGRVEEKRHSHLGKVLLVDDAAGIRMPLKVFMEMRGLDISEAADGRQALERVYLERPRLAIVDDKMPGMTGIELLRKIKEFDPSIQVILISGTQDMDSRRQAAELGVCDYLIKPFSLHNLEAMVLSILIVSRKEGYGKTDTACGQ